MRRSSWRNLPTRHPRTLLHSSTWARQFERAESWFLQAVNLKGGSPGREDFWNLGICKKNMAKYEEALPMLEQALAEFQEHEPEHPVTISKLHSTVAGCLHDMGRPAEAIEHYEKAHQLYTATVGPGSPLFCSAAEGMAKSFKEVGRYDEAYEALLEAFDVHARGDAVHPTPLFENLELALKLSDLRPSLSLARLAPTIDAGINNLERRGMAEDGNAGLVMCRGGKVLLRAGQASRAAELLHQGVGLIRQSHEAGEADLSHEIMEADMLLKSALRTSENSSPLLGVPSLGATTVAAPV